MIITCPVCDAKGYVLGLGAMKETCYKCHGSRHVSSDKPEIVVDRRTKEYKTKKKEV